MATLDEKQAAFLQETLLFVGHHSDDYQLLIQTEESLWTEYEARLLQSEKVGPSVVAKIKANPDHLDRIVSLINAIRLTGLDNSGNMAMDNLQENVRLLDEKRDKERLAREAEAERKLAQQGSDAHAAYQKQLALLKQVIAAAKETDPQVAAALESSLPDIAPSLVLEPIGTIEKLAGILAPEILAPLTEIYPPVIENVYLQTTQVISDPTIAAAVTILKISTPETTIPQIQQLLDRLTLTSEAIGKPLNISQTAAARIFQIQAPPPTTPPLILSLHNQFLKAGYPTPQAQTLAAQFATQFVPLINTIASFTPHQPSDSPQQHAQRVSQVQVYFSNQVIEYLSLRTVYFTRPAQFYSSQDDYSPSSHLTPNQSGWLNYLVGSAKNKVLGKAQDVAWERFAASEVGQKVLTSLGTKAATTAALAPETLGLSLLIPLAIEAVKNLWSKGKVLIKEYLPAIFLGLAGLVGGVVAGLGLVGASALALTGAAAGTAIQGSGGVAGALTKAGNAVTSASTAAVGLVATEIAAPIIIIIISIPIGVALILFIINSSALVVPSNPFSTNNQPPQDAPRNISCPIINGVYKQKSYESSHENDIAGGHGSNYYWNNIVNQNCTYPLPQTLIGCQAPVSSTGNKCQQTHPTSRCPFYGYAADLFPAPGDSPWVYAPSVDGNPTTWNPTTSFSNSSAGYSYLYQDQSGKYVITFTHMDQTTVDFTKSLDSGKPIGKLYNQGGNTHLHLEMQASGLYVKPENYLCQ